GLDRALTSLEGNASFDQERRTTGNLGLQQLDAVLSRLPILDDDVVQLVAQELVDHLLVRAIDLQKVSERTDRRALASSLRALLRSHAEDVLYCVGRI